jgi:hypothetical protein
MIAADLEKLKFAKRKEYAQILEKELGYINRDLISMAATGALLSGFSFGGLNGGPIWCQWSWGDSYGEHNVGHFTHGPVNEFIFAQLCTVSLCINLMLVARATCLATFGPYLALHVKNESNLQEALNTLRSERQRCLRQLGLGAFFFGTTQLVSIWYRWRNTAGLVCTAVVFFFAFTLSQMYDSLKGKFGAPSMIPKIFEQIGAKLSSLLQWNQPDVRVLHEGYLMLRVEDSVDSEWAIRYFQLLADRMRFARTNQLTYEGELIFVTGMHFDVHSVLRESDLVALSSKQRDHVFEIRQGPTRWVLQGNTEEDRRDWVSTVDHLIK